MNCVYKMLDTLQTVKKFKQITSFVTVLASGYINVGNFDYGPIFSSFGYNEVEGVRLRAGGRTYFGTDDTWRLQGIRRMVLKTINLNGLSGKWMVDRKIELFCQLEIGET
jgi:hypothetical protein